MPKIAVVKPRADTAGDSVKSRLLAAYKRAECAWMPGKLACPVGFYLILSPLRDSGISPSHLPFTWKGLKISRSVMASFLDMAKECGPANLVPP